MSTLGVPLKSFGYNGSNELCGRSMASKLRPQQADTKFHKSDTEICEKQIFNVIFFLEWGV